MTERITIDKKIIDDLVVKANVELTGNTNDWNITNPAWMDGYKEGMLQAVNAVMAPVYLTDHQQTFAVGEYYFYKSMENVLHILKITAVIGNIVEAGFLDTETGKLINTRIELDKKYVQPATAEQIATFKRAEHFASKGRKLDEFKGWDTVAFNGVGKTVIGTNDDCVVLRDTAIKKNNPELILIQTAEELQEVGDGEDREN